MKQITDFVHDLANTQPCHDSVNQYAHDNPKNAIRRANLTRYLQQMHTLKPKIMLIAEAPGYRGARLTGVPFSSRAILQDGIDGVPLFRLENGYQLPDDTENTAWKEATATIVWNTIHRFSPPPLNWNSYPFHPHLPDKPLTNRKPHKPETEIGKHFLTRLIAMFDIEHIVAVGNTAEATLNAMNIPCEKVRHPAQGGKNDFVTGIQKLFEAR